jgi:hypothetical protein
MTPIAEASIEQLRISGPCGLDEGVTHLPYLRWGEVFAAVNQMWWDGRVSLHQLEYSNYQIALWAQVA